MYREQAQIKTLEELLNDVLPKLEKLKYDLNHVEIQLKNVKEYSLAQELKIIDDAIKTYSNPERTKHMLAFQIQEMLQMLFGRKEDLLSKE